MLEVEEQAGEAAEQVELGLDVAEVDQLVELT